MRLRLALFLVLVLSAASARAVEIAWTAIGSPGNAPDFPGLDGPIIGVPDLKPYGAVSYSYRIGTYDVTNRQYVEFLNAKDPTGANVLGLYSNQGTQPFGGITRNLGGPVGSRYTTIAGAEDHPVNYVNWFSAIRFANWLNNGQANGDTENGAYTILGGTAFPPNGGRDIVRSQGAKVFLPSQDEWYKAAFYDPRTTAQGGPPLDSHYWNYATTSNIQPISALPSATPNRANFAGLSRLTNVGAYSGTTSPFGAFDMAGNVDQWVDTLDSGLRVSWGGSFLSSDVFGYGTHDYSLGSDRADLGFRVAAIAVPEPSSFILAAMGVIGLVACTRRRLLNRGRRALPRSGRVNCQKSCP